MCQDCKKKPYYITTAIAYASGKPHIGNTYEIVLADSIREFDTSKLKRILQSLETGLFFCQIFVFII